MARTRRTKPRTDTTASHHAERYVCIHGHFYQPPRENPWLETVEEQVSAAPFHDWNERITAECYAPNGASRILKESKIVRITNNYARMSFNFGPTLLSWLQEYAPRTYKMVIDADAISAERFSGHGSAMAQVYNHIIMPLANTRDALTQIRWGIADFEFRFGRKPEGMWLAETAVNSHVLDLLAQEGIKFTLLAPHQAARVRPFGDQDTPWVETSNSSVNITRPYLVRLPEGRSISVFFYDGPISRAIAFEGLLNDGAFFANRMMDGFPSVTETQDAQMMHVATDGESYGHHHKHGDMALAYAMQTIEEKGLAKLTNFGEFLAKFPPTWEAQIAEDTSWSCAHGIERWRSHCGCNGGRAGWNQQWRTPLRHALDQLRDALIPLTEELGSQFFYDIWRARDAYIRVILNRSPENEDRFLHEFATHTLDAQERVHAWELLELQRHAQLMYTSCGWFFDDISGIETVQIIAYAGRVLDVSNRLFPEHGARLQEQFLQTLADAKSNLPDPSNGAEVYRRWVQPMLIGLEHVGAHYAISSIFRPYPEEGSIFCFNVRRIAEEVFNSGRGRLAIGRAEVQSRVTEEREEVAFAVLHMGDQNLSAAVCRFSAIEEGSFESFSASVRDAMERADLPEVIHRIDHFFGKTNYSLSSLFHDEQRRILRTILDKTVTEVEESLRKIYQDHASLLNYLSRTGLPSPPALELAAGFALNASLRQAMETETFDGVAVQALLKRASEEKVRLNEAQLSYSASQCMSRAMHRMEHEDDRLHSADVLAQAVSIAETLHLLPFEVDLWEAQNIWNELLRRDGGYWPHEWREQWLRLGQALDIDTSLLVLEEGILV